MRKCSMSIYVIIYSDQSVLMAAHLTAEPNLPWRCALHRLCAKLFRSPTTAIMPRPHPACKPDMNPRLYTA
jgi:hypothetical protein